MTITRTYSCNLCRDKKDLESLIGLHWSDYPRKGYTEKSAREVENHICMRCLSDLQAIDARCGQGYKCKGGPTCGSDHK